MIAFASSSTFSTFSKTCFQTTGRSLTCTPSHYPLQVPLRQAATMVSTANPRTKLNGSSAQDRPSMNSIKTLDEFWSLADESKTFAQYDADSAIRFLREATLEEIRSVCLQYRYFVERYPDNLARLLAKMPNQQLKSLLCSILAEEMGSGQISGAHIQWYDRFLKSIGVTDEQIRSGIYDENEDILSEIEYRCFAKPFEHVVGVVGMGGECLCQIYLTAMYKNLKKNPNMTMLGEQVDWEFWTYHVGEEDIEHRRLVRECINEMVMGEESVKQLAAGYVFGKSNWDNFWHNNFKNTRAGAAQN